MGLLTQLLESSDYLQECRNPHSSPSLRTSSPNWSTPVLSWGTNKDSQQGRPRSPPALDGVCGRFFGTEKEEEEIEQPQEDCAGQLSETDSSSYWFPHQRAEKKAGRKSQPHRAAQKGSGLHGDIKISSITTSQRSSSSSSGPERTPPQEPIISQVPLRLQIKVPGQRGSLGFSIAGGRGSLPYKENDEGIFISRVIKGGASEKAGVHVGDRLMEVNGLDMQGATHHQAVSALRNAGSCIKMKVLRERLLPREVCEPPLDVTGQQLRGRRSKHQKEESREDCMSKKVEAVVCNGNCISDLERELKRTLSELEAVTKAKNDSLQGGKHTMTIPRIILTHPSTSDEDVELLTQSPNRELQHDDVPDRCCFDSAFYPL
ncbi:protein scribble homolog [Cheilinus undulatus]|uniref:protein scribble homolog n=1 Tax=Cheilinus undulatus TaxID=241271 RepID=UPI001BD225D5|nr:protein scribble homolog [Cheilinus undulatus]